MLRNTADMHGFAIEATDGRIGHVRDLFFDDAAWVVRYLVVDTGAWLSGRQVLLSPISAGRLNWSDKLLAVSITKEQVKNSPDIDAHKPVSRQQELQYLTYYGYPRYWGGADLWGAYLHPGMLLPDYGAHGIADTAARETERAVAEAEATPQKGDDPHLRSCDAVENYHIHAADGDIGHVEGLLFDDESWAVRYVIANTSNWWLGHKVLVAPKWIEDVSWKDGTISVDLTRQAVKDSPLYDATVHLDRDQETALYRHYRRPEYWTDEVKRETEISRI